MVASATRQERHRDLVEKAQVLRSEHFAQAMRFLALGVRVKLTIPTSAGPERMADFMTFVDELRRSGRAVAVRVTTTTIEAEVSASNTMRDRAAGVLQRTLTTVGRYR